MSNPVSLACNMLFLSTTYKPATDLGFLLHKNPARVHEFNLAFGKMVVAYPEATEERTTAAVLLQVDPVGLVRGSGSLDQYVNDRPYVASSHLSVALVDAFSTAMNGKSKDRPELVNTPIPLTIRIPVLPCRTGVERLERLFQPLGYHVSANPVPLDDQFPEWGSSPYLDVTLSGTVTVQNALRHVYILLPVLDARKHYYMDRGEVEKLLRHGEGWLKDHPERNWIVRAYLGRKPSMVRDALGQLAQAEEELALENNQVDEAYVAPEDAGATAQDAASSQARKVSLHDQRHQRLVEIITEWRPRSVLDVGCGEGKLLGKLIPIRGIDRLVGMDVAYYEVEKAIRRLRLEDAGPRMRERVQVFHGSLMYRDVRLRGFEVCVASEVIEHLDPPRLRTFEQVIFGDAQPEKVLITTPNRDYNAVWDVAAMRHEDHRFEWNLEELKAWADRVAEEFGYKTSIEGLGEQHETYGFPSQLAVFTR